MSDQMTTMGERADDRKLYLITGSDAEEFLQGLVTSDMKRLNAGLVYTALLSPQGKYLADFFLSRHGDGILLDANTGQAEALIRRLTMYRLRADVQITPSPLFVQRGLGDAPQGALADPRHESLGWRLYSEATGSAPVIDWDAIRVDACIPESGIELVPDDSYILESGFERMGGVDFRKGCYVGQEVTARMKHKTELRKGLVSVMVTGDAPPGTEIHSAGKVAGQLLTRSGDRAIAYLRFDRTEDMTAGDAQVTLA